MSGYGTNWQGWLQYLYDKPGCEGNELGAEICDSMQQKYAEMDNEMESSVLTLSTIDLSEIDNVEDAFDEFFTKIGESLSDPDKHVPYAMSSMYAEKYAGGAAGMVDLADLADKARGLGVADDEAVELHDAVNAAVTHCVKGRGRSYSHGLAFFDGIRAYSSNLDHYARYAQSMPYLAYLDAVHADWEAPDAVYSEVEKLPELPYEYYVVDTDLSLDKKGNLQLQITNGLKGVTAVDYKLYRLSRNSDSFEELGSGTEVNGDKANRGIFTALFDGKWPAVNGNLLHMDLISETGSYDLFNSPMYVEGIQDEDGNDIEQVMNMSTAILKDDKGSYWTEDDVDDEDEDENDNDDDDDDDDNDDSRVLKPMDS